MMALLLPLIGAVCIAAPTAPPTLRVAALHDTGPLVADSAADPPEDRLGRLVGWVDLAAEQGAQLFITPEYVLRLDQAAAPLYPGKPPSPSHGLASLAAAADRHDMTIIIALWMHDTEAQNRNAQVVLGPEGTVIAIHHKMELFAGERAWATPGEDVQVVAVDGYNVGLLICADLYAAPALHARLVHNLGAQLIAVSAEWTAPGAARWGAAFAHDWSVPVVFANTGRGDGVGSGIFAAGGTDLARSAGTATELLIADVPLRVRQGTVPEAVPTKQSPGAAAPTSPSTRPPTPVGSER